MTIRGVDDFGDSYYQGVCNQDIVERIKPLFLQAGYKLRDSDGKIFTELGIAWESPWHHVYHDHFFDCHTWHRVIFDSLSRTLPPGRQFVPSACHQCWKVVVRPRTLKQLFALMTIEQSLGRASKLGIEVRETVFGLYGGYFYNHSLQAGIECWKVIKKAIDEHPDMSSDTPVILKRACTEYEMLVGPSDKWGITPEQVALETLVNKWFVRDTSIRDQPSHIIAHVHRKWIEYAYMNGDETYKEYTNGQPVYKPVVTYHHLVDANEVEQKEQFEKFSRRVPYGYHI